VLLVNHVCSSAHRMKFVLDASVRITTRCSTPDHAARSGRLIITVSCAGDNRRVVFESEANAIGAVRGKASHLTHFGFSS
jgi:hypothetical protein